MLCGQQYAAVATQIGIAARQEAPLRRIKPSSPHLSRKRRIVELVGGRAAGSTALAAAEGYVSEDESDDGEREEVILALQEQVEDLAMRVCFNPYYSQPFENMLRLMRYMLIRLRANSLHRAPRW